MPVSEQTVMPAIAIRVTITVRVSAAVVIHPAIQAARTATAALVDRVLTGLRIQIRTRLHNINLLPNQTKLKD